MTYSSRWFVIAVCFVAGCAAIPEHTTLVIESKPSGALVHANDGWECTTPCTQEVDRDRTIELAFTRDGYSDVEKTVEIPEFKRSRAATVISAAVGGVLMGAGASIADDLGMSIVCAILIECPDDHVLSSGEKLLAGGLGATLFGAAGRLIDNKRDEKRAKDPVRVEVELDKEQ